MESIPVPRPPAELPTEAELMSTWHGDPEKPLVTVLCMTFNHERFIRDAIHGFLIQRTTFPFHIIIHDDASKDKTPGIVKDFEDRYPNLISGIYQKTNLHSKGVPKHIYIHPFVKGQYVAFCEGDDYWTDPEKLAIQVAHMERNPWAVLSIHDRDILEIRGGDDAEYFALSTVPLPWKKNFSAHELKYDFPHLPTLTRMCRIEAWKNPPPELFRVEIGDAFQLTSLGVYGGCIYIPEIKPSVYRRHAGGVWSGSDKQTQLEMQFNCFYWLARFFYRIGDHDCAEHWRLMAMRKMVEAWGFRFVSRFFLGLFLSRSLKSFKLRTARLLGWADLRRRPLR